ncbi:uncharacterized protein IWZ02DRAFT_266112 [Phyllosticta citriasiana]|uniref:Uncharacterized protein n=1 Tax=Phyllosticta citriasiana TaxID=595635 RepID=A0ABR1KX82_9PEZI
MGSHQSVEMPLHTMSLAPFNAAIGPIVDLATVLPPTNQIPPRELPHGCNLDEPPTRFTYDPITYFKTATATFTLILDHTTLIPQADGSTETSIAPFKTTIEQPYTETLTKPTDGPSQPSSPSVGKEGVVKERRQGEAPITEVVVVTEWTTVTALDTVTVHLVPSAGTVTQEITATFYPVPAPLTTERNPPVPMDEHHLAAAAAAAAAAPVLEGCTKKSKLPFGVQRHTPHTPDCAAPSITCTVTIISTTSIPVYPPFTSFPTSTPSTTISVTSSAAPSSTFTTSTSAISSSSTISSSLATTTTTFASASSSLSSAATTTPSATPTPSISNAGAVGGGGKGGAALAATMAVLWGLLAIVGIGLVG